MLSIDMELHLPDALGHILACLDSRAFRVLALHGYSGHDGVLDEDLDEDPLFVFWKTLQSWFWVTGTIGTVFFLL